MYVNQLSKEMQDTIKSELESFFHLEGFEGQELSEAVQNGMDSKLHDLEDILPKEMI